MNPEDLLESLADRVHIPALEMRTLAAAARRRQRRRAAVGAAAVGLASLVVVVSLARVDAGPTGGGLAEPGPAPAVPSDARLRAVLREAQPPATAVSKFLPPGPVLYNTSPWGADGRTRTSAALYAVATTSAPDHVSVNWETVDPPLDADEADRVARGITPPDPDPLPPPDASPVPLATERQGPVSLRAYEHDGQVFVFAWSADGGLVLIRAAPGSAPSRTGDWLAGIATQLLSH